MKQTNYLQSGSYHCLTCHKTSTPTETCAHVTIAGADIPTTPCSPACGGFYKAKEIASCKNGKHRGTENNCEDVSPKPNNEWEKTIGKLLAAPNDAVLWYDYQIAFPENIFDAIRSLLSSERQKSYEEGRGDRISFLDAVHNQVSVERQKLRERIKNLKTQCSYHGIAYSPKCKECDIEIAKEEVKEDLLKLLEEK